ncbi:MAG: type VI secretion system protein TssA [Gammaproteobacteria bacterium]
MPLDVAALTAPLADDAPAGENLEYDAAYIELGTISQRKPDQQYGATIVPGEEPDWGEVQSLAVSVLERTRDLRPAMILTRALVRTEGLPGLRDALALVQGYCEQLWDTVHPQLDPDDDNDPTMRLNALLTLVNVAAVLRPLREAPLARSRMLGSVTLKALDDIDAAAKAPPPQDDAPPPPAPALGMGDVEAIFRDCPLEDLQASVAATREALDLARRLQATVNDKCGLGDALDTSALVAVLKEADAAAAPWLARREAEAGGGEAGAVAAGEDGTAADGESAATARVVTQVVRAGIHSRDDALRAIDELVRYFQDNEPTSPVPLLLTRARRWVTMDFISILDDFAPDAAREAERLRGSQG